MAGKRAKQVGKLLVSQGQWTEEDRRRCRELVRRDEFDSRPRPAGKGVRIDLEHRPELEAHIARLTAEVEANDPGHEPVHCWAGCGRTVVNGQQASARGWQSRPAGLVTGAHMMEVICPECFEAHGGFIQEGPMKLGAGREAVLGDPSTAGYARLTDAHVTFGCHDCEAVLLAEKYAADVQADPAGLPPLAAGTITLAGGRTLRFCARCIGTHVIRRDDHTAGGGDRRADKPVGGGE